jgi:hypothetical protein
LRTVRPGGADCPQRPRGQSSQVTRTVRKGHADRPARSHGPSVKGNRTTRTDPRKTDRPRIPGGPSARVSDRPRGFRTVRYRSSDRPQTGCNENLKQNRIKPKQNKNTKNTTTNSHDADRPPGPRGPSARHRQCRKLLDPGSQHSQSITGSPKW